MPIIKSSMAPVQQGDASGVPLLPGRITHDPTCPNGASGAPELDETCPVCGCMTTQQLQAFLTQCRNARIMGPQRAARSKSAQPRPSGPVDIDEGEII